jgi:hypothetical protein
MKVNLYEFITLFLPIYNNLNSNNAELNKDYLNIIELVW